MIGRDGNAATRIRCVGVSYECIRREACEVSARGFDRADPHGASRGQKAGRQGKQKQEPGCKEERGKIVRADLVEQAAEQAGKGQSQEETGSDAGDREQQSLTQHQPENVGAFGAQREADADFLAAWRGSADVLAVAR